MKPKHLCAALAALYMANAAFAALSPETQIIAPPLGENADWGQVHAATVTFRWAWPSGATSAQLTVVANGRSTVVSQDLSDTSVSSFTWNCGTPSDSTIYDVTLEFSNGEVQTAQIYSLPGSFSGAQLKAISSSGSVPVCRGEVLPYRASWGDGLAGIASFSCGTDSVELPYSSGYFLMNSKVGGYSMAALDFEMEPESPAFSCGFTGVGFFLLFR